MAQFVSSSINPEAFRKCQLDYRSSEFSEGKKKLFELTSHTNEQNSKQNLYKQKFNQGQSKLMIAGNQFTQKNKTQKQQNKKVNKISAVNITNKNELKLTKCQLKNLQQKLVYPIKIGKEPLLPFRTIQSAKSRSNNQTICFSKQQSIENEQNLNAPIRKEIYKTKYQEPDANTDFFDYLQDLNYRPLTAKIVKGPQFRGKKLYRVEEDRLDRMEFDSQEAALKKKGLSKTQQQEIKKKKKEKGNTLVLGQSIFEYTASEAGKRMIQMLQEYNLEKGNKKKQIVKKGRSEMSSGYPPMFDKAKYTKNLYYKTTYNNFFTPQSAYTKPAFRFGTTEFKKKYNPTLFNF